MRAISQTMVDMQLVRTLQDVLTLSAEQSSSLFDRAIVELMNTVRTGSTHERRRWMEMSVSTLYALVLKHRNRRKRRRQEEEEEKKEDAGGREEVEAAEAEVEEVEVAGGAEERSKRQERMEVSIETAATMLIHSEWKQV